MSAGKLRFRNKNTPHDDVVLPAVTAADITYLGAYQLGHTIGGLETITAMGLALRYETTDVGHEVHLLTTLTNGGSWWSNVIEWRDQAAESGGADPTNCSNYSSATVMKQYGNPFGTGPTGARRNYFSPGPTDASFDAFSLPAGEGLWCDPNDTTKLYVNYCEGYDQVGDVAEGRDWCMNIVTLNYAAGTTSVVGPYKASSNKGKGFGGGFTSIRPGFVSTYLGGTKRILGGFGGYRSVVGNCEASLGPAAYAIDPAAFGSSNTTTTTQTLLFNGVGNAMTPRDSYSYNPALAGLGSPAWASPDWGWCDVIGAGAYVYGANKAGLIVMGTLGQGLQGYVSAHISSQWVEHKWMFYSEAQIAAGLSAPSAQLPTFASWTYPSANRYQGPIGASIAVANISSITSNAAKTMNGYNPNVVGGDITHCAVVTCSAPHGLLQFFIPDTAGYYPVTSSVDVAHEVEIAISNSQYPSAYDGVWSVRYKSTTELYIFNLSSSLNWDGHTAGATGTVTRGIGDSPPVGAAFDPTTRILYVLRNHNQGESFSTTSMIEKYLVNC